MAASTDLLCQVGSPGTITSLSAPGKAIAASSINIGSATGWPTATAVFFALRRVDPTLVSTTNISGTVPGTYTEWKGTLSGTTISNLSLQFGTDQVYAAGTNTQVLITIVAARENAIVTWGTAQHDQLGAHTNITATGYNQSSGSFSVPNNVITAPMLATSAITLGYAQITADFTTAATSATQVTGLTTTVTIPAGGRRVKVTAYCLGLRNVAVPVAMTLSIWEGTVGSGTQLQAGVAQSTAANGIVNPCTVIAVYTPTAGSKTYNVGFANNSANNGTVGSGGSTSPAFILVEAI